MPTNPTGQRLKVVRVDLRRRDIATTSTGKSWGGKHIQSIRDRYSFVRANVQSKRTRSSHWVQRVPVPSLLGFPFGSGSYCLG